MKLDDDEDVEPGRLSLLPECKCVDLTLADGTKPGCKNNNNNNNNNNEKEGPDFCLVAESPCLSIGAHGEVERSQPVRELNGLIHKSELLCKINPGGIIRK